MGGDPGACADGHPGRDASSGGGVIRGFLSEDLRCDLGQARFPALHSEEGWGTTGRQRGFRGPRNGGRGGLREKKHKPLLISVEMDDYIVNAFTL